MEAVAYLAGGAAYTDRARHRLPALFLLDLKMPRMSGFEVRRCLGSRPELTSLPVVVLSSSPSELDERKAKRLGAGLLREAERLRRRRGRGAGPGRPVALRRLSIDPGPASGAGASS